MATNDEVVNGISESYQQVTRPPSSKGETWRCRVQSKVHNFVMNHPELICMVFSLILSHLSTSSGKLLVQDQPPPQQFYASNSIIIDYYDGSTQPLLTLLEENEILLVIYYAPWCAHAKQTKVEVEKAAWYFLNQVTFVAVNCFYYAGECSKKHTLISYPAVYFYHLSSQGFQFKDELTAENLINFIQHLMYPLDVITTQDELSNIIAMHQEVVVATFYQPINNNPMFEQFYYASMRMIEHDWINPVNLFVNLNTTLTGNDCLLKNQSSFCISYHSVLYSTVTYPQNSNHTSSSLIKWIYETQNKTATSWVHLHGAKSLINANHFLASPSLLVLTNRYTLDHNNNMFHMIKELSYEYNHCDVNASKYSRDLSALQRWSSLCNQIHLNYVCSSWRSDSMDISKSKYMTCKPFITLDTNTQDSKCQQCSNIMGTNKNYSIPIEQLDSVPSISCLDSHRIYHVDTDVALCCDETAAVPKHLDVNIYNHSDPHVKDFIVKGYTHECRNKKLKESYKWIKDISILKELNKTGKINQGLLSLGCTTNRTLNFAITDRRRGSALGTQLGYHEIDHQDVAFIIDIEDEAQYKLEGNLSQTTIAEFILNYTNKDIERDLKYKRVDPVMNLPAIEYGPVSRTRFKDVQIQELNTLTFEDVVVNSKKDVVVFYYAPWCGFCKTLNHVYIQLAEYFKTSPHITFARIDSESNDLPWEFTVDAYPTLQIYPAQKKSDNMRYDETGSWTFSDLVDFVLTHSMASLRVQVARDLCSHRCLKRNRLIAGVTIKRILQTQRWQNEQQELVQNLIVKIKTERLKRIIEPAEPEPSIEHMQVISKPYLNLLSEYEEALTKLLQVTRKQVRTLRELHGILHSDNFKLQHRRLTSMMNRFFSYQTKILESYEKREDTVQSDEEENSKIHDEL